jgi:hypothetical protein
MGRADPRRRSGPENIPAGGVAVVPAFEREFLGPVCFGGTAMRLPDFRVRTLMVVVGVVALLIWGARMGAQSYDYYRRASHYSFEERGWRDAAVSGGFRREVRSECADYFARLAGKYRRAMWRPWMPVAPDPHAPGYDQWVEQERRAKEAASAHAAAGVHPPQ